MWGQQTENAGQRYAGQRKTHVPRSNFTNVIFHRNLMAKNTLELTLSGLNTQKQLVSRSLEGSKQAFILRKLLQQESVHNTGIGHVSLLPEGVARSHQGLLRHRPRPPGGGQGVKDVLSPRGVKDPLRRGQVPRDHLLPAITPEQRLRAERRRCKNLKREMEALQARQAEFFDSLSEGLWVKPRLTVTPEPGGTPQSPPTNGMSPQSHAGNRLGAQKYMALPSIITPKVFSEKDPPRDQGIFRNQMWRQEGSWK